MLTISKFIAECDMAILQLFQEVPDHYPIEISSDREVEVLWLDDPIKVKHQYWVEKFVEMYKDTSTNLKEGLLFLPNNPTTAWFQLLRDEVVALCWLQQSVNTPDQSQIVAYFGDRPEAFYRAFSHLGCCAQEMIPGIHFGE